MISRFQSEFFISIIGEIEYNKLVIDCGVDDYPVSQIWIDFLEGKQYENSLGYQVIYAGIKPALKDFIFYSFLKFRSEQITAEGLLLPAFENGSYSKMKIHFYESWNSMYEKITFGYNSVFAFLTEFKTDYPNFYSKNIQPINQFGI